MVLAPASVANVVCGFDVMGFALNDVNDRMVLRLLDEPIVRISNCDTYELPTNPDENVIGVALQALMERVDEPIGFEVISTKIIKPGSGIGSSAASAAGAVVAANHLLNNRFSKKELVECAMAGEALASGSKHADNIAPVIYGGFTIVRSLDPLDIISITPPDLYVTILHPQIEVKTAEARALLQPVVPLDKAIAQWANVAGLVAGMLLKDYGLIGRSLVDHVVEPTRQHLIPGYKSVKNVMDKAQALGGGISGSGPSMFALSTSRSIAEEVLNEGLKVYDDLGIICHGYVTTINHTGVQLKQVEYEVC